MAAQGIPPAPRRHFDDRAGFVSAATAAELDARLAAFESETRAQLFVAVFPSLPSPSLEDFTVRTAQAWRVGQRGMDNGAILFVFVADRRLRIEVGYGFEGRIPDAIAKRIVDERIAPLLRAGSPDAALVAGVEALIAAARGQALPAPASPTAEVTGAVPPPDAPPPARREPGFLELLVGTIREIAGFQAFGLPVGIVLLFVAFPLATSPLLRFLPIKRRVTRGEALLIAWLLESAILLWIILSNLRSSSGGTTYSSGRSSAGGGGGRFGGGGASGSW